MKEEKGPSTPREAQSRVEIRGGGVFTRPTRQLAAKGEAEKKAKAQEEAEVEVEASTSAVAIMMTG